MAKLTEKAKAAKIAKMRATKAAKKAEALKMLGYDSNRPKAKKIRKKRNLSPEQKAAAIERLKKAREAKGPSVNKLIAENVRNLPDEDKLSLKNVRGWIKDNKDTLRGMRWMKNSKDGKERGQYYRAETYIANMETYLRTGVWVDLFYGDQQQHKIKFTVAKNHMAYYPDGTPKRAVGYFYEDINATWTREMELNK